MAADALLGPDSAPRRILSLARGREPMYWVRQLHGLDYRVNASHILSLKRSRGPGRGEVVNLSVREWLGRSEKFQNDAKGYKVAVEFPEKELPVEPYFWACGSATGLPKASASQPPTRRSSRICTTMPPA